MRRTYRSQNPHEYWNSRWDSVDFDAPMQNSNKYPLSCSLDILDGYPVKDAYILEAGCGTGRILRYLHDRGYNIVGIDFIKTAIDKIHSLNLNLKAEFGDITNLRFKKNTFTHVLSFGLYHNFEVEPMKIALVETHRVLQPGGFLCASFRADNLQNYLIDKFFSSRLGLKKKSKDYKSLVFHKINLTYNEIDNIFKNSGFEVLKIYTTDNMPLLYKIKFFRNKSQKEFNENIARRDGYSLNIFGRYITNILKKFFPNQFCSLYVVIAKKNI